MRSLLLRPAFLSAALLLGTSTLAVGQAGAPATGTGVSITPFIGVLVPTKDLLDYQSQVTKLSAVITFGGRLGIGLGRRVSIEGDLGYSPGSLEFSSTGTKVNQDVHITTGSGRLTLYLIPRTSPVWIGVGGGVAAVRHSFSQGGYSGTSDIKAGTNVGGVVSASAGFRLGRVLALYAGVDDYLYNASFDVSGTRTAERKQNDFRVTGGLRIPFVGL